MYFLDFLSESPNLFVFQTETNKTNFGGVLFLIYIIIMLLISLAYILDYALNDKYTYEAMEFYNNTDDQEEIDRMNNDDKLNPIINITISLNKNFVIADEINREILDKNDTEYPKYKFSKKASDIKFIVAYRCGEDETCSSFNKLKGSRISFGTVNITYPSYEINHSNTPPFYENKPKSIIYLFGAEENTGYYYKRFEWEVIKYKDQKSLFDTFTNNKKEYIFGHIKNDEPQKLFEYYDNYGLKYFEGKGYFMEIYNIELTNNHDKYLLYKRKKIEFIDALANVGSLFSTVKFFFALFFSFYSKNFDNYKILGKILKSPKDPIKKIELSSNFNIEEEKDNKNKDLDKKDPLIDEALNENKIHIKESDINKDTNENNIDDDNSIVLDKLSFIDYFYNNIYTKCCKRRRNQELINSVNEIVYKYLSIDSLLYNQLKLEGLFKDYKWNNPSLSNILNNIMIKNLKNI